MHGVMMRDRAIQEGCGQVAGGRPASLKVYRVRRRTKFAKPPVELIDIRCGAKAGAELTIERDVPAGFHAGDDPNIHGVPIQRGCFADLPFDLEPIEI